MRNAIFIFAFALVLFLVFLPSYTKMQDMGRNIAIVENDKKEFVGVVTLEDLLEEIVGEIK